MQIQIRNVPYSLQVVNNDTADFFNKVSSDILTDYPDQFWILNNATGEEHYSIGKYGENGQGNWPTEHFGLPVVIQDRGGQWTYHGPGQVSFVLILNIRRLIKLAGEKDRQRKVVEILGEILSEKFNIALTYNDDDPGLYLQDASKVASYGAHSEAYGWLAVKISINLNVELRKFAMIDTCGQYNRRMANLLPSPVKATPEFTERTGNEIAHELIRRLYDGAPIEIMPWTAS